jgi:hypothetical protein
MKKHLLLTSLLIVVLSHCTMAQTTILNTPMDFECHQQRLGRVLEDIAAKGHFYFSWSGTLFNKDSLVTLSQQTRTVREILDLLFHGKLQYLEDGRYLILLPAVNKPMMQLLEDRSHLITGVILDRRTGIPVDHASVYDPRELSAAMSGQDGRFVIRVKNKGWPLLIAVSKDGYADTIIELQPGSPRELTVSISPDAFLPKALLLSTPLHRPGDTIHIEGATDSIDPTVKNSIPAVEATGFGRLLLSYRLRMQSLNLKGIFVQRPVQLSLAPGASTNGPLNSQVVNKFSLNAVGGYAAGLDGVELGGVFNIDRKNVTGLQAAGVINIVGGSVHGIQLAGICNDDLDSVNGFQAAGLVNRARYIKGLQLAELYNYADTVDGMQWAPIFNRTRHLKGFQIGLINIADTSEGVSIGLLNFVHHGLYELSFYADELSPLNLTFRSGTYKFYGILYAGMNPDKQHRSYYYGGGFGHQFPVTRHFAIRSELTFGTLSPLTLRHLDNGNSTIRFNVDAHWQIAKKFAISAGPSFDIYYIDHQYYINGKLYQPISYGPPASLRDNARAWIGWHIAIEVF